MMSTIIVMRTTLDIPDDVLRSVRSLAQQRNISLGAAAAELIRLALHAATPISTHQPFPCFDIAPDAPPITLEDTLRAEDDPEAILLDVNVRVLARRHSWDSNLLPDWMVGHRQVNDMATLVGVS